MPQQASTTSPRLVRQPYLVEFSNAVERRDKLADRRIPRQWGRLTTSLEMIR
jgi:hypothetical protein